MSLREQVVREPPPLLFRYAGEWAESFFNEPFLRFSAATRFNDPFDFLTKIQIQAGKEVRKSLIQSYGFRAELSEGELSSAVARKLRKAVALKYGVLCLSEIPDDILMWAHYASAHTGCVLGFDSDIVRGFRYEKSPHYTGKVVYQSQRARIPYPSRDPIEERLQMFFVKAEKWRYEQEWRLVLRHGKADGRDFSDLNFRPDILRWVIIGCRANEANLARRYRAALRGNKSLRHVRLFTAECHTDSFELIIRNEAGIRVDWREMMQAHAVGKARSPKKPWYAEAHEARGISV